MRVLLTFDKFKDSLTAPAACDIAARALRETHPHWTLDLCPLTDGGEGFGSILGGAARATIETHQVTGPRGGSIYAAIGYARVEALPQPARALLRLAHGAGKLAIVEMAEASGLALLPPALRDPWATTTLGTGQLIRAAIDAGAIAILLGVGGSATHDLGLGALGALGLDLLGPEGQKILVPVPAVWSHISRLSGQVSPAFPPIRIACDVTNPLTGPRGAAATYGPQKGLRPADLARLDAESARMARLLCVHCGQPESLMDVPGAGAAGGISFGLMTAAGAQLLPGFDLVSAWLNLEARLTIADLVITGEGRFDDSSLQGKGPGAVAARALALGKKVHVFAGRATAAHPPANLALHSITPAHLPLAEALPQAAQLLAQAVRAAF